MTLNSNQFGIKAVKGFVDASTPNRLLPCKIADTETATLKAGSFVKVANVDSKILPLLGSTASADAHAGVLVFTTHRDEFVAKNITEFAPLGSGAIVLMEATGAISNGATVYADGTTAMDGVTATQATGASAVGHAFDKANASGDLIRVILDVR